MNWGAAKIVANPAGLGFRAAAAPCRASRLSRANERATWAAATRVSRTASADVWRAIMPAASSIISDRTRTKEGV
jgi:hypothetical protein